MNRKIQVLIDGNPKLREMIDSVMEAKQNRPSTPVKQPAPEKMNEKKVVYIKDFLDPDSSPNA